MRLQWHATLKLRNSAKTPSDGISSSSLTSADSGLVIWVLFLKSLNPIFDCFPHFFCNSHLIQKCLKLIWAFHPILVTWFLVVFGDEVTKILRNSLFSFRLAHLALQMEKIVQKITQPKRRKTKIEVTKICDESGKYCIHELETP